MHHISASSMTTAVSQPMINGRRRCSCCFGVLIGTKRMEGRRTASQTSAIGSIVFVALHIRLDVAGRHRAHVMPERADLTRPEMRSPARLHPDRTRRKGGKNIATWLRRKRRQITTFPAASTPWSWKTCFAISMPMVVISLMDGSRSW